MSSRFFKDCKADRSSLFRLSGTLACFERSFSMSDSTASMYDSKAPHLPGPQLHDLEKYKLYRPKSNWEPTPGKCGALESYIDAVESDIEKLLSKQANVPDNLNKEERSALQSLKNRDDIVIKKADKGSTVVVLDKDKYIAEAHRQLSDERFYMKLDSDPTEEFSATITKTLDEMYKKNEIGDNVYETLNPIDCRPGQFYLLPKIHKEGMPGRPIVSAIGHPTEKISEYIDLHLRPHVEKLPSYLKDTTDYINKTPSTDLPDHTLLVTMDVTSLYTNIPHDEGIEACREVWDRRSIQVPSTESLTKLLEHVLKCNNFMFNGEHYLQINGTAMGTKMAPSYANIFMGRLERNLLLKAPFRPLSWLRFIDDIEMKWVECRDRLEEFISFANSFHQSIKFTVEISDSENIFLDTTSTLIGGKIEFNLHTKPTDSHLYLMPTSCHPPHTFKGVPKGLATRIRRICSSSALYQKESDLLKSHLCKRGYKANTVQTAIDEMAEHDRQDLLRYKQKDNISRVPLVTTYHPVLKNLNSILKQNLPILHSNKRMVEVFKEPPLAAYRRPRNLKDMVVRTRLDNPLPNGGFKTCSDRRCLLCKHSSDTVSFNSPVTGRCYRILGSLSCQTDNCIYLISCKVCQKQYIGETGDLRRRINNHRSTIKTKKINEPVGEHFNLEGHKWEDMTVVVIDHNPRWTDAQRKSKEKFWMHRLKSFRPNGINKLNDFTRMNVN
uniref:Uncharacterized protein LOC111120285 n=2 Tax=Crassostrea virginica TaxID=6565 RepID=A0A8B8CLK4_CRAVI|nr:uncharacterized protein LOC111120285 [Crassostrea virginica]